MTDRAARRLISLCGIGIIVAVLGILVFLVVEIAPLLRPARLEAGAVVPVLDPHDVGQLALVDEHQERAIVVGQEPVVRVVSLDQASRNGGSRNDEAPIETVPLPELEGLRITATARALRESTVALGTDAGSVWVGTLALQTKFEGSRRSVDASIEPRWMIDLAPGYPIRRLAMHVEEDGATLAAIVEGDAVIVGRIAEQAPLVGPARRTLDTVPIPMESIGRPTQLVIDARGRQVLIGTDRGLLARWALPAGEAPMLIETVQAPPGAITSLAYVLGDRSIVVGGADGSVATWSLVRDDSAADGLRLTRIHTFPPHASAVTDIAASPRDKGFITVSQDGQGRLAYMTSERVLGRLPIGRPALASSMAPKVNGWIALDDQGRLHHWRLDNPHPDVSWQTLFGRVWYEGYVQPDHIWQSTGGTDDFEPKYSLVPLVFGTLKGTVYALLFAVPLALFGGLYCSQFLEKRWRNPIKSTIELMAALPSVVLGFLAGVMLAPLVQQHLVAVLIMPFVIPLVAVAGMLAMRAAPAPGFQVAIRRHELALLVSWVVIGAALAIAIGPWIERVAFGGRIEAWLLKTLGERYDQRNAVVVGWAMGFAIVPIIFTVCEDAFSAVPRHLVAASLACGASRWQTAWRVVLPAAGSGVFSAIMIGFGRAVGETMIVLMATGNTPIMSWSPFNGFRALSANIAVEIAEAPQGGSLYRVLFVASLLLFGLTFVVNTVAELVRSRLRRQLHGL